MTETTPRITLKTLTSQLVELVEEATTEQAFQAIKAWYTHNVDGGDSIKIGMSTPARTALIDSRANVVGTLRAIVKEAELDPANTPDSDDASSTDDAEKVGLHAVPDLVETKPDQAATPTTNVTTLEEDVRTAKAELLVFIVAARKSRSKEAVAALAEAIFQLGTYLDVPVEDLLVVRMKEVVDGKQATRRIVPTTAQLELPKGADGYVDIMHCSYYKTAVWMTNCKEEPDAFLAYWYWPGIERRLAEESKPKPAPAAKLVSVPSSQTDSEETPAIKGESKSVKKTKTKADSDNPKVDGAVVVTDDNVASSSPVVKVMSKDGKIIRTHQDGTVSIKDISKPKPQSKSTSSKPKKGKKKSKRGKGKSKESVVAQPESNDDAIRLQTMALYAESNMTVAEILATVAASA